MQPLDIDTAEDFLRARRWIGADEEVYIHVLSAGESCVVLYVRRPSKMRHDFVLKQARPPAPAGRGDSGGAAPQIRREIEVLRVCEDLRADRDVTIAVRTPRVLCEDLEHHVFAMTAAPPHYRLWRQLLLAGRADCEVARGCGRMLAELHGATWGDPRMARRLGDAAGFDACFRRQCNRVRRTHGDLDAAVRQLMDAQPSHRIALAHGAFGPGHLLVGDDEAMLIGYAASHVGDPALDVGSFLSRLVLAAFRAPPDSLTCLDLADAFDAAYRETLGRRVGEQDVREVAARSIRYLGAGALARVEGAGRVEYVQQEELKHQVRQCCRSILLDPSATWEACGRAIRTRIETR